MFNLKYAAAAMLIGGSVSAVADEPLRNPYQEQADQSVCYSDSIACAAVFPASSYHSLLIKHVSCEISVSEGLPLPTRAGLVVGHYVNELPLFPTAANVLAVNVDTYLFLRAGDTPQIVISGTTAAYFQCTISGYHD